MEIRYLHHARNVLGESALWSRDDNVLYWLDQLRPELHGLDPYTGENTLVEVDLPAQLGAVVLRACRGLALVASDGVSLLGPALETRRLLCNPIISSLRACFNDHHLRAMNAAISIRSGPDRRAARFLTTMFHADKLNKWRS
jgi:xylono-1,5-lactonase